MPAYAGAAIADVMPGTTSKATPAAARAAASSPPRAKTNGSPPFRRTTVAPVRPWVDEQLVDLLLRRTPPRGLADGDPRRAGGGQVEEGGHREAVVDDDVGAGEQLRPPHGEQARVTGSGADEVDGHSAAPPWSSR